MLCLRKDKQSLWFAMEKLSILIPIFNWDCRQLLEDLHEQAVEQELNFQLVAIDDASTQSQLKRQNAAVASGLKYCKYLELTTNLDRASMRNYLAKQADGDIFLFIDCDAGVINSSFLTNYLDAFYGNRHSGMDCVIVGGLTHSYLRPREGMELRYYYELEADKRRSAEIRSKNPYAEFTAFSFLISSKQFKSICFDENITEYGYEDVLFGAELQNRGIGIVHIDNPLVHMGIESSESYLRKVETSLKQAAELGNIVNRHSKVAAYCLKVSKWHLRWAVLLVWHLSRNIIKRNLLGRKPNLKWLSFYKLGYFMSLSSR